MRSLYLLRHSLTEANETRAYCGRTDLPLSRAGRELAGTVAERQVLPPCDLYVTSGMARADETLKLLTQHEPDLVVSALREMDFGRFEMLDYAHLKADPDYLRWIEDATGTVPCPGGECSRDFRKRVQLGGDELLLRPWQRAVTICHGGVIVCLMQHWFPDAGRGFYDWQPSACSGWQVDFDGHMPLSFTPWGGDPK